jgi:hypothetical protein
MRHKKLLIFLSVFFLVGTVYAAQMKSISLGKFEAKVFDDGIQSATNLPMSHCVYRRGYYNVPWDDIETNTNYPGGFLRQAGTLVGCRNWTDTLGNFWPCHVTGHCAHSSTLGDNPYQFNVLDEGGLSIRRIFRFPPPEVIVDGNHCEPPFGSLGDFVDSTMVWGSADLMIEMHYRLSNGMDVYQRNLAWSEPSLDDGVIWDLTFINTGNTDHDDDIELPDQTLDSVVIFKHYDAMPNGGLYPFGSWAGVSENNDRALCRPLRYDSVRINYVALARKRGHDHDSYGDKCEVDWGGDANLEDGCGWTGHVVLFAPKNTQVHQTHPIGDLADIAAANDPAQPSMHSTIEGGIGVYDLEDLEDTSDYREPYCCMRKGIHGYEDTTVTECETVYDMNKVYNVYDTTATGAKTYYDQPQDRMGEFDQTLGKIFPRDWPYYTFSTTPKFSIGPYNMAFGDTLRFVYAVVAGSVDRKTTYILSRMRANDSARYFGWLPRLSDAQIQTQYERRDPVAAIYGDQVYMGGGINEIATDYVISTGKDSLLINGMEFQRAFNKNYEVPASPNPPSRFEVKSRPEMIELSWSYEDYPGYEPSLSELAGFKIYRAFGGTQFELTAEGTYIGDWQMVDSVGPDERSYADTAGIVRGYDYYYCLTAVSPSGKESGKWLSMTQEPFSARLLDYPEYNVVGGDSIPSLDSVVVVPNPLNIRATEASGGRYPGSDQGVYQIGFRKLPPECIVRIFTESGELIQTIEHTNGSGTEFWQVMGSGGYYMTTVNNQRPASGLYIAHIQIPETGEYVTRKFIIIR